MSIQIPNVIGMPPSTYVSDNIMKNSLPVIEITPGVPAQVDTFTAFKFSERIDDYLKILKSHGFEFEDSKNMYNIQFAIVPDNFPSDTFTNEYSENFLQKMAEVTSDSIGQLAQMTGSKSGTQLASNIAGLAKKTGNATMTDAATMVQDALSKADAGAKKMAGQKGFEGAVGKMAVMANQLVAGARADFPQLWRNSSFSPSYSFTIRLYNPDPGSDMATQKYIVGPLAALLLLSLPHGMSGGLYSWPYIHKVNCPGMFMLNPCYISNINIVKGGDQQQIAWNQRLAMVDVRIDFASLFNTIIAENKPSNRTDRPTLQNYLESLSDFRPIHDPYENPFAELIEVPVDTPPTPIAAIGSEPGGFGQPPKSRVSTEQLDATNRLGPQPPIETIG